MQIQVLTVELNNATSKAGKAYEQLVVAYKDLTNSGKVASKTIMPFGFQKDSFTTLKAARSTDVYDIDVQKNDAGYNDWIRATKGTGVVSAATADSASARVSSSSPTTTSKGGWETPEERAKKQIYIVRQSSISAAVNALSVGVKTGPKPAEVIEYARELERFVFSTQDVETVVRKDVGSIETMEEDPIPY